MKYYVVIQQPDGDWDNLAEFLGVYSTEDRARDVAKKHRDTQIFAVEVDTKIEYGDGIRYAVRD